MSALPKHRMTIPEFLDWTAGRDGKYLLLRGEIFAMAPESIQHARVKAAIWAALQAGIKAAGLPCEAIIDGPGVAIADDTCYIPDVSVTCGERAAGNIGLELTWALQGATIFSIEKELCQFGKNMNARLKPLLRRDNNNVLSRSRAAAFPCAVWRFQRGNPHFRWKAHRW
jgi:Putative restriction endonuclease